MQWPVQLLGHNMLSLLCLFAIASRVLAIRLENNSYKDVIVAINRDVEEDASLLQAIKDLVTDASPVLYHATRKRAYFGEVTIVVPDTWEDKPDYVAASARETYRNAKVRIDPPSMIKGQEKNYAFVQTMKRCGIQGLSMHITPKRLTDPLWRYASPPHKMFIHQWGHLRWGIFDEYYRKSVYGLDFDGKPARCVQKAGVTQLSDGNWKYNASGIAASLMWRHFHDNVVEFCDDSDNATVKHYRKAKNDQNYICNMKSSWEVMRETDDFYNDRNPPRDIVDIRPTIKVVRRKTVCSTVLVLDTSNSMALNHRLTSLRQAIKSYINGIATGSYVGIVYFNSIAIIKKNLTKIENADSRNILHNSLPTRHDIGEGISIGGAILTALELFSAENYTRKRLLIVSAGVETCGPYIMDANVQQSIENSGVQIHTIAFGEGADKNLLSLRDKTGGMAFFSNELSGMQEAVGAVREYESDDGHRLYQVAHQMMVVPKNSRRMTAIDIDGGIDTVFNFYWTLKKFRIKHLRLYVISPRGKVYRYKQSRGPISCNGNDMMCTFKMADVIKPGEWRVKVDNKGKTPLLLTWQVFSHQSQKSIKPTVLETHISHSHVTFPQTVTITASLTKGSQPVVDAFVSAVITRPASNPVTIRLQDNGVGADLLAYDGLYTATFTQFTGTGFYNVKVIASHDYTNNYNFTVNREDMDISLQANTAHLGTRYVSDDFRPNEANMDRLQEPLVDAMSNILPKFTRIQSPGMFRVDGYWSNQDAIPPSRIMDLRGWIVNRYEAELTWTSPGDDMDNGKASSYSIRFSTNFNDLVDNFTSQHKLIPQNVLSPGFSFSNPKMSGFKETLRFMSPVRVGMVFVAVKSCDDGEQWSGLSNVVHLEFRQPVTQAPPVCNCPVKTSLETAICKHDFLLIGTVAAVTDKNIISFRKGVQFLKGGKFLFLFFGSSIQVKRKVTKKKENGCLCPRTPEPGQTYLMSGTVTLELMYTEKSHLQLVSTDDIAWIREIVDKVIPMCSN